VAGTGTNTQVSYWNGTNSQTSDSGFTYGSGAAVLSTSLNSLIKFSDNF
jgi:hypothetical protein